MILTRKIISPVLVLFALLLLGLFGYIFITFQASNGEEEQRFLSVLSEAYSSEVENNEKLALSLATEVANNTQVQEAFASQDREKLRVISTPIFERMRQFNVTQLHFHNPPGISFLRVHQPETFGDDLNTVRQLIADVNTNQQPVAGMEANQSGVGIHGIVPVYFQGKYIGSLEIGIDAGNPLLNHLAEEYGNEWHILLTQEAALTTTRDAPPNYQASPIPDLLLNSTTENNPVFNSTDAYRKALDKVAMVTNTALNGRQYGIYSTSIPDHEGKTIAILDVVIDRTDRVATQNSRLLIGGLAGLLVLVAGGFGIALITSRALNPINDLTAAATDLANGNLTTRIEVISNDEVGELSAAFNGMAAQVRELIITLEERVSERTHDLERRTLELETIAAVTREISTIRNMDTLLHVASKLIRERFSYYHTGIYLFDERDEYATLQAASGEGAQQMLEQRFKLIIGEMGPLGTALRSGQAYVSLDVPHDNVLGFNPLLPETISEIILPLRVLNVTIGAVDIQSNNTSPFAERDIRTLQLLGDQLAAAIENAQLVQRVEGTVTELNKTYRSQTRKVWQTTLDERAVSSYEYDGRQVRAIPQDLPHDLMKRLESGKSIVIEENIEDDHNQKENQNTLLVPLMVLNQLIGVIGLEQQDRSHIWTEEEMAIAEAAANRAALTLENARLLEESQRRAVKESTISEATARIGSALNVENILDITAEELERVIGNSEIILQINTGIRPSTRKVSS